ncbi:unnamed protein product [Ceratitis capitata]|uniref:(Mediterranean fruit fly) hypothetical protein n=1 Tax=Ceratitis capitata TaxID=7213 RepID=A0A811U2B4_CERCA|nr:unnamed protein product [Ceratitis capitata]
MRVMEPYVLPISNRGGAVMPSGGMHKKQQAIDKSNRSNKNNNSNISKRNTDASIVNNHINRENMNTYNNNKSNSSHIQSQNQHNKQYIEHTTATTSNVNNANSIVVQPQHATLFGWQDIESKIIAALRGVDNAKGQNANDKSDDEKQRTNAERDATVVVGSVVNGMNNLEDAQFSEVLLPLRNILDKVTQFCVTLKHIINEDEGDLASSQLITADESDEAFASTASAAAEHAASILQTLYTVTTAGDTAQLLAEVQGQRGVPTIPPTAHSTSTQQSQTTEMVWTPQLTTPQSTAVTASVRGATTNANKRSKRLNHSRPRRWALVEGKS